MQKLAHPPEPPVATALVGSALQPLDYTSLRAVLSELTGALVPSRFEKAQQSDANTLQLGLRTLAGNQWLELSWLAEAPRLLAIPPPPRQGEGSTLAQQLQHGLRGLALVELHQPAWERVVELRFAPRPGEPVERTLVLELMGRHSNLFLLDAERRVIALARQVRDRQSRLRPIGTGDPYQSPPGQAGEPPRLEESFDSWRQRLSLIPLPLGKALLSAYQGTSPALVRQLLEDPARAALPWPQPPVAQAPLLQPHAAQPPVAQQPVAEQGGSGRSVAGPAVAQPPVAALPVAEQPLAELSVAELSEEQWQRLWRRWQAWLQALEQRRFSLQWGSQGTYRCWSSAPEQGAAAAAANLAAERASGSELSAPRLGDPSTPGRAALPASPRAPGQAPLQPGGLLPQDGAASAGATPPGVAEADGGAAGSRAQGAASPGLSAGAAGSPHAPAAAAPGARTIAVSVSVAGGGVPVASQAAAGGGAASSVAAPGASAGATRTEGQPHQSPGTAVSAGHGRAGELPINRGLAAHYAAILGGRQWRQRRQALESRLQAAIERERRQLAQQQELLQAVPAAEGLQRQADALLCQSDPSRETIDEAQALYRRARKLRRSAAAITPRIDLHQQRLAGLETSLTFLEQLEPGQPGARSLAAEAQLVALEQELLEQLERLRPQGAAPRAGGRSRARRQAGQAEPQPLELHSPAGLRLQVGRNHRQNEWISLRQARRGDLWFHAQELPGSHVVLKGSEAPPAEADLQAAADLAAHFSRGRGNRRVPVLMVVAETLQRIPGAEPGTVRHRGGEVLWGEPERALALLQRAGQPQADGEQPVVGQAAATAP